VPLGILVVESHNPRKNGNNMQNMPLTCLLIEVVKGIKG